MSVSSSIPEDQLPDLSHLTETERNRIMDVLKRDERLNKRLNDKFLQLKQEIDLLESRSVDMPSEHIENATNCARCLQAFGYFFNTGELCPQCGYKVCQSCRVNQAERSGMFFIRSTVTTDKPDWLCILCHKYNEYLMQTGEWIHLGQESRTLKSALRNHLASTSSAANIDAAKLNLSGSQLVKISLFPNKKQEIIQELEQSNFKRSSLSKRYSMIKKAKSNSLTPQMNRDNNDITTSEDALSMISLRSPTTSTRNEVFFHNNEYQHKKQQQSVPSVNVQPPSASTPKSTIFEIPQLSTSQKPKPRNLFFVNQLPPTPASPSTSTPNADNSSVLNRSANLSIKALASNISYQVSKFTGEQSAASNATLTSYSQDKNENDRKTTTATSSQHFISWESSSRSNLRATTASKAEEENFDDDFASVTSSEVDTVSTKSETRLNKLAAAASLASAANKTTTTTTTTTKWQMGRLSDAQANITASSAESSSVGQRLTTTINMSNNSGSNRAVSSLDIAQKKSSAAKLNTTTTTTTTTSGEEANVSHEEKTPERVSLNKRMSTSLGRLIRGRAGSSFKIKNKNNTDNTATNNNNNEQDDEFAQIDQVFAKAKAEKLKNEQQSSSHLKPPLGDKANQNRSQPTLNPGKLFAKNTNNNSDKTASSLAAKSAADLYEGTREMSVDPEEEYLKQATNNDNTNKSGGGNGNKNLANKFHTFNYRTMPGRIKYDNSMSTKMEKSESLKSVNETVDSNITVRGKLKLQVTYETLSSNLSVHISACENLASLSNKKEICDPYVKVYLMPGKDKNSKRKTSTKKSTINPIFEETLRYTISSSKLASHKLWISVWHHDKFGKNKFLGEIMIPLDADHLKPFAKLDWHELEPKKVDIESFYQTDTNNRLIIVRV